MNALPVVLMFAAAAADIDSPAAAGGEAAPPPAVSAETSFRHGVDAYDEGKYDAALKWFRDAYRLAPEPSILFNIAQAYRARGECREALEALDAVITANGADRSLVNRARGKRDDFERCANAHVPPIVVRQAPLAVPRDAATPAPLMVVAPSPAQARRSSWLASGWARGCMVGAGATLGLGVAGAGLTWAAHDRANVVDGARTWSPDIQAADDQRRSLATGATTTFVVGGVSAILTATMCWLGWHRRD